MPGSFDAPSDPLWSDLYAQLSEFFKEPSPGFVEDVASGRLARFFEERRGLLGLDTTLITGLAPDGEALGEEYRRLFTGPMPPYIVPVESVYKRWANSPDCQLPIALEKGYLMGDPALDMLRRYRDRGMEVPDAFSSMPDHLALELEYLAFLASQGDDPACREFLSSHLDCLGDLVRDIENAGGGGFYLSGARIARDIVKSAL